MTKLTLEEIAKHNTDEDCWLIFKDKVYDVSAYLEDHPGGVEIITDLAGQDTTEDFEDVGHSSEAYELLEELYIGDVGGELQPIGGKREKNDMVLVEEKSEARIEAKIAEVRREDILSPRKNYSSQEKEDDGSSMFMMGAGIAVVAALGLFVLRRKK